MFSEQTVSQVYFCTAHLILHGVMCLEEVGLWHY